ncbi:MAG: hypothetical protein ACYTGS_15860 [Planctomycetota bacterium]|jgi:hypothetical protein
MKKSIIYLFLIIISFILINTYFFNSNDKALFIQDIGIIENHKIELIKAIDKILK